MTALMLACTLPLKSSHSRQLLVRCLIGTSGVEVDIKEATGKTALMLAAYNGHMECCELLIKEGHADVKATDKV
jgi:ankyrin repeat protein